MAASTLKLRIDSQGNVGIGTLAPLHKVHVGRTVTTGSIPRRHAATLFFRLTLRSRYQNWAYTIMAPV
jgi:hypothetical protein